MPRSDNINSRVFRLREAGKTKEAYLMAHQLSRRAKAELSEHHPCAESLHSLALIAQKKGEYSLALELYQEAIAIRRKTKGQYCPEIVATLNNMAEVYREVGSFSAAEPLYEQAIEIDRILGRHDDPEYGIHLNNLGTLYVSRGSRAKAIPLLRDATIIFRNTVGENHPYYAANMSSVAALYESVGDDASAARFLRLAVEILRGSERKYHRQLAICLHNLAEAYFSMGDYAAAEPVCHEALAVFATTDGDDDALYAEILYRAAWLCAAKGNGAEVLRLMRDSAAANDRRIGQVFTVGSEKQRIDLVSTVWKELNIFLSLVLLHIIDSPGVVGEAADLVLRRKAISAEALLVQSDTVLGGKYPDLKPKLQELTDLRRKVARIALTGSRSEGEQETHRRLLEQLKSQKEHLEVKLARHIPEMKLEQAMRKADRYSVAQALPEGVALIEFIRFNIVDFKAVTSGDKITQGSDHYAAFVLPPREPENTQLIDLGRAKPIDEMVAAFRKAIAGEPEWSSQLGSGDARNYSMVEHNLRIGRKLRSSVFDPLISKLGNHKRFFLAPDGDLTKLPFETLPTDNGCRLIDDYHFTYLSTGRAAIRLKIPTKGYSGQPIVVAAPDFDLTVENAHVHPSVSSASTAKRFDLYSDAFNFAPLPDTRAEGQHIAKMLGVKPWLGGEALEGRLKASQSPRILHFATHGFFLENKKAELSKKFNTNVAGFDGWLTAVAIHQLYNPGMEDPMLRSGLALAGANTWARNGQVPPEAEDGILTAEDICGMDLLDTDLVVLSACETGLGDIQTGEGVFGLRRAFTLAGAKTLVMSLWKVPDKQTRELMEEFYRRILAGESCAEALRQAQLVIKAKYAHPLYWGAFICQGKPDPLAG